LLNYSLVRTKNCLQVQLVESGQVEGRVRLVRAEGQVELGQAESQFK